MKEFNGTRGEWKLNRRYSDEHGKILFITIVDEDNRNVVEAKGHEMINAECMANAQLIAAAPELLDALIETDKDLCVLEVNMAQIEKIDSRADGMTTLVSEWRNRNKKAINKALGL